VRVAAHPSLQSAQAVTDPDVANAMALPVYDREYLLSIKPYHIPPVEVRGVSKMGRAHEHVHPRLHVTYLQLGLCPHVSFRLLYVCVGGGGKGGHIDVQIYLG
jgi:hypothetical protein